MSDPLFNSPSVGRVVKKIVEINPDLTAPDVISILRQCMRTETGMIGEFAGVPQVDEEKALLLARNTLKGN